MNFQKNVIFSLQFNDQKTLMYQAAQFCNFYHFHRFYIWSYLIISSTTLGTLEFEFSSAILLSSNSMHSLAVAFKGS